MLVIVTLSVTLYKEYSDVVKAQEVIGSQLSTDVNDMSIFVKGVKNYIFEDKPDKPMSEKKPVTKEDLSFSSGSANVYYMQAGRIQLTQPVDRYFGILGTKLNELAQVWNDPKQGLRQEQLMKETLAVLNTLDECINLIQKSGEDRNGVNYRLWYLTNNDHTNPIHKDVQSIVNQTESEWKFLKN